jgi:2'-5' RNA ligase
MKPGDRLVCAFVDQLPVGTDFKEWPLHVTIVPWFRADVSSYALARGIKTALSGISPFEIRVDGEAVFGRDKTVNLIEQPTPLNDIESQVRSVLKNHNAWLVDESTKKKRPFKPHVTAQKSARLNEGEGFLCDRLYIVEQKGDHKSIEAEIPL